MGAIEPKIMRWARETAGMSLHEAAHALGMKGDNGRARLAAIEDGTKPPSRPLLLKMAKEYRRPLITFYLAAPPPVGDRGQDFRTLPGAERFHPDVDALVRDIKARQGLILSMLEDDDAMPVPFVGSARPGSTARTLALQIAETLGFSLQEFRAAKNVDDAFMYLRTRIESAGVFVLLVGNLGSHHSNIPVALFRGFALSDPIAPIIVINDQDAHVAWAFTAMHELVHLWFGDTGISGTDTENKVEQFCNEVAGELLLPAREVLSIQWNENSRESLLNAISAFADSRRVSRSMVAYKLARLGRLSKEAWEDVSSHFAAQWTQAKQREAEKNRAVDGGPNYYVIRRHRVGKALLSLVRRSLDEGNITYTKASRILGVKPRSVEPLLSGRGAH